MLRKAEYNLLKYKDNGCLIKANGYAVGLAIRRALRCRASSRGFEIIADRKAFSSFNVLRGYPSLLSSDFWYFQNSDLFKSIMAITKE